MLVAEGLLPAVKVFLDWLRTNPDLIIVCAQVGRSGPCPWAGASGGTAAGMVWPGRQFRPHSSALGSLSPGRAGLTSALEEPVACDANRVGGKGSCMACSVPPAPGVAPAVRSCADRVCSVLRKEGMLSTDGSDRSGKHWGFQSVVEVPGLQPEPPAAAMAAFSPGPGFQGGASGAWRLVSVFLLQEHTCPVRRSLLPAGRPLP